MSGFDPSYPTTERADLFLLQSFLQEGRDELSRRYPLDTLDRTDQIVAQHLGALLDRWADPNKTADAVLAEQLTRRQEGRDECRRSILREYGANTIPPSAFAPLKKKEADIQDAQEVIDDRRANPERPFPSMSPYQLWPVRHAIMLQAKKAPDPSMRDAARDLAARKLSYTPERPVFLTSLRLVASVGSNVLHNLVFLAR